MKRRRRVSAKPSTVKPAIGADSARAEVRSCRASLPLWGAKRKWIANCSAVMTSLFAPVVRAATIRRPAGKSGYLCFHHHSQRCCQAIPTALNSLPVRVVIPVLALNLMELCRSTGRARVKPTRVLVCSLSPLTPFTVVRPPVK